MCSAYSSSPETVAEECSSAWFLSVTGDPARLNEYGIVGVLFWRERQGKKKKENELGLETKDRASSRGE